MKLPHPTIAQTGATPKKLGNSSSRAHSPTGVRARIAGFGGIVASPRMNDLELWERLSNLDDDVDLEGLAASVHALAELSAVDRAPFLGFVDAMLSHPSGAIRGAGAALLGGARGQGGIERIVETLDDDDTDTRAAAVQALRKTAGPAPHRWAHAVFHPREDVRRLALETPPPSNMESLGTYLRADPSLRELARQSPWPANPCGLVFDMFLRGHVDAIEAGDALAGAPSKDLRKLLIHSIRRTADVVGTALGEFQNGRPLPEEGRDLLDLWCRIYWACEETRPTLHHQLVDAVLGKGASLRSRAAFSLLLHGQTEGHLPETLQLAVACQPSILRSAGLSIDERRIAVVGLRLHRERLPRVKPGLIDALVKGPLVGTGSDFDLETAALLASFVPVRAIATLRTLLDDAGLVRAAIETESAWSALAELPDDADGGPMWFLPRMAAIDVDATAGFIASAAGHWLSLSAAAKSKSKKDPPPTLLDRLVDWLEEPLAAAVLVRLTDGDGRRPSVKQLGTLTELLMQKLRLDHLVAVFDRLLPRAADAPAQVVLQRLFHYQAADELVGVLLRVDAVALASFCTHAEALAIPRETELKLAKALDGRPPTTVSRWASAVLSVLTPKVSPPLRRHVRSYTLSEAEVQAIATADEDALPSALAPALSAPALGLCDALRLRPPPAEPSLHASVALIASRDRPREVARELDRFGSPTKAFIESMAPLVVECWQDSIITSPLCNAFLHRWEKHGFALLAWLDALNGGLAAGLRLASDLDEPLPRTVLWDGISRVVVLRRYRQGARLRAWATAEVMTLLVEHLDTDVGPSAARMLATFHITSFASEHLERLRDRTVMLAPDMDAETRRELDRWVRIDGLEARATPARRRAAKLGTDRLSAIRASNDVAWLVRACGSANEGVIHEATLRLVELGGPGQRALAGLLDAPPCEATMLAVASSVSLWSDEEALEYARGLARDSNTPSQHRFRIAVSLHERPEQDWAVVALAAVAAPSPSAWLTKTDWELLETVVPDPRTLSTALAGCVHPHAYQRAVKWLLDNGGDDEQSLAALGVFLRAGTHRPAYLRRAAARRLLENGERSGMVVCLRQVLEPDEKSYRWLYDRAGGREARTKLVRHALDAALLGGREFCGEERCLTLVQSKAIDEDVRDEALQRLLLKGADAKVRETLVAQMSTGHLRDVKLGQVAELFAWGVRKGRELTGRYFSVHMTEKRQDLGYTRMTESTIYVSPLPLMRGDRHGKDVVEALILHEYGHHLYHRDEESQRLWKRAHHEGIGSILNLVADEHLERRLRAVDATYGDRLKRLAAYAFQHTNRELRVQRLLQMFQASSFDALSARPLGVAFEDDSVVVDSGLVLRELDRRGHPFARFVRAMRMGLGNRHGDPLLDRALALFKGGFRHKDMRGLYEVAIELSLMYGSQSDLADAYGGHESLEWGEREGSVHGSGIGDADVQQEVERILRPPSASANGPASGKPGGLQINVGSDDGFQEITKVVRVAVERDRYRQLAVEVRRHAYRLRTYFEQIGLALVPRRARLRGRAFDRTRVHAVVTRRDPRMLVARELEVHTDLFVGVVVDCSGSMSAGGSMEKAHRFGVLLAEAARGLPGIDARFFGFTDRLIYDAGDERNCGVTSLQAGGGNNDAAGLYYAASVAAASRRRAKLLVMISDGLPTECSVQALRGLVQQLTRRKGILCAQVAVRPLTEVCFPHYVELLDSELDRSVRRFGEIVSGLARRALGR
jgi:hypothetical protein